ncbi:sushi domain-containing protein 4-like [Amphiura filiformis]|uniref:sushi domain-containing protein 4-like n=1 Tax=Amphiura filiformis TaxID=82378 RepID=UPI003B20D3CC
MLLFAVLISYPAYLLACVDPGTPAHSIRSPVEGSLPYPVPVGTTLHYQCMEGYALKGSPKITCTAQEDNTWLPSGPPECRANYCEDPRIIHGKINGQLVPGTHDQFVAKTFARLICDPGFMGGGTSDQENFCMPSGEWARQWDLCSVYALNLFELSFLPNSPVRSCMEVFWDVYALNLFELSFFAKFTSQIMYGGLLGWLTGDLYFEYDTVISETRIVEKDRQQE